jgi:hypothetical protein
VSYLAMGTVTAAAAGGITTGAPAGTMAGGLALPPVAPPAAVPPGTINPDTSSPMMTYVVIGGIALAAFLVIKHVRKGKHTTDHHTARTTHPASTTPVASEG